MITKVKSFLCALIALPLVGLAYVAGVLLFVITIGGIVWLVSQGVAGLMVLGLLAFLVWKSYPTLFRLSGAVGRAIKEMLTSAYEE